MHCTPHFLFFFQKKKRKRAVHGPKEKKKERPAGDERRRDAQGVPPPFSQVFGPRRGVGGGFGAGRMDLLLFPLPLTWRLGTLLLGHHNLARIKKERPACWLDALFINHSFPSPLGRKPSEADFGRKRRNSPSGGRDDAHSQTSRGKGCMREKPRRVFPACSIKTPPTAGRFAERTVAHQKETRLRRASFWCARRDLNPHVRKGH